MNRTPWSLHANSPNTVVAADGVIVAFFPNAKDADAVIAWSRMGDLTSREELKDENLRLEELGEASAASLFMDPELASPHCDYRRELVQVAAVAMAAVESFDRQQQETP